MMTRLLVKEERDRLQTDLETLVATKAAQIEELYGYDSRVTAGAAMLEETLLNEIPNSLNWARVPRLEEIARNRVAHLPDAPEPTEEDDG